MTGPDRRRMAGLRGALALGAGCCALAACGDNERRDILRDIAGGQDIAVRIDTGESRRDMTIAISPVTLPRATALQAAGYEAARHCLRWTGESTAEWTTDAQGDPAVARGAEALVLRARCAGR